MWNSFDFDYKEGWLLVVFTALLLWAVFIFKEWKGKADNRFYINLVLGLVAILCFSILVLRPTYLQKVKGEAILLTEGYQKEILDSIKRTNRRISSIEYIPGMDLSARLDSIDRLLILGHGVREFDLWQFKEDKVSFLPTEISNGIVRLKYNRKANLGSDLIVEGDHKSNVSQMKLVLLGPGGLPLDSLISKIDSTRFKLRTNLKVPGNFLYHLQVRDSTGSVVNMEPLPVEVSANKPLKILVINEFPFFETKYLKNFLSEEGHEVIVKTKLTKQKYKFEYFNTARGAVYSLNKDNLQTFDLIIFDDLSLKYLSRSEQRFLAEEVTNNGLGVFVQQTGNQFQAKNLLGEFKIVPDNQTSLQLPIRSIPVLDKYPVLFDNDDLLEIPIDNYGNSKQVGRGSIGSTILKDTYQLLLDGKELEYKEIWSSLINGIRKRADNSEMFHGDSYWAFVNEPFNFSFFTSNKNSNVFYENEYRVPLIRNSIISDEWEGTVYPRKAGWHKLTSESDSAPTFNFYAMKEGSWNTLTNKNTLELNKRYFKDGSTQYQEKLLPQRMNPIWFFVVFLITTGYLWLEPKLR